MSLTQRARTVSASALRSGALEPIKTVAEVVEDGGVQFIVRVVDALARKDRVKRTRPKDFNPFLPYDEALFVSDLSATHVCLLNKFNVLNDHLLIVTRAFEAQQNALTLLDFEALASALSEVDGLCFYNGGEVAGASQRHKHLQLVPFPLAPGCEGVPIEPLIDEALLSGARCANALPFEHALCPIEWRASFKDGGARLFAGYEALLSSLGLRRDAVEVLEPYNLLATRRWMMIVPRRREHHEGISINALGFAGALLVRDREQRDVIGRAPMRLLASTGRPPKP